MIGTSPTNLIKGCAHVRNVWLEVSGSEDCCHFVSEDSQGFRDFSELCWSSGLSTRYPSSQLWYQVTAQWYAWYSSFNGEVQSMGAHTGRVRTATGGIGGVSFGFGSGFVCVRHQVVYSMYCNEITVRFSVSRSFNRG